MKEPTNLQEIEDILNSMESDALLLDERDLETIAGGATVEKVNIK